MAPVETLSSVPGGSYTFFGGKSCPVNFARVPDWCCHALATMAGLATSHCVDDVLAFRQKNNNFLSMAGLAFFSSLFWLGCTR